MPLVVIEGPNGAGKGMLIEQLEYNLRQNSVDYFTSSWNSYPPMRSLINNEKDLHGLTKYSHYYSHLLDLTFRYEKDIIPRLKKGEVVICDRYIQTLFVRDGIRGISDETIAANTKRFKKPDVLVYLDTDLEILVQRMESQIDKRSDYILGLDIYPESSRLVSLKRYLKAQKEAYDRIFRNEKNFNLKLVKNNNSQQKVGVINSVLSLTKL